ncbi:MAG TPA: CvpA family protein, partial [Kaistia sp.]|nr:CvpA family protein [Kaistia sp.]
VGLLDRILGFCFGVARGLLLVVIAFAFLSWILSDRQPAWVANAQSAPILKSLADKLVAALPEDIEKTIQDRLHGKGEEATPPTDAPAEDAPDATPNAAPAQPDAPQTAPNPGYGTQERQGLDNLFDNSGAPPAEEPDQTPAPD